MKFSITLALIAALSATVSAGPVKKPAAVKAAAAVAADTPACTSSNNGQWACTPDRAECYNGSWLSYPCGSSLVCQDGQCVWPYQVSNTTSASSPTSTTKSTSTSTSTTSKSTTTSTSKTTVTSKTTTTSTKTTTTTSSSSPTSTSSSGAHIVVYADNTGGGSGGSLFAVPGSVAKNSYNVINLAFWLLEGPWDTIYSWTQLDSTTRQSYLDAYHAAGVKVLVTAFGATDYPVSGSNADPVKTATNLASFVKQYGFDGCDIDWEDNNAMDEGTGEAWLISFQTTLRQLLPRPYIITHAPQAPYFVNDKTIYKNNAYIAVDQAVGDTIDWYNVQFYNQGDNKYDTCETLLFQSGGYFHNTSLFEIHAAGVPLSRLVIGKPITAAGATNTGYTDVNTLASCLDQARAKGWDTGVMGWQFNLDTTGSWSNTLAAHL